MSKIDQLVDATSEHRLLSFINIFVGYNRIRMASKDEKHTVFVTNKDIYCYKIISFGLKNIRVTYQRLVNKIFKARIVRNMEVYMDDMLVKNPQTTNHIRDLEEVFSTLRRHQMKLNPTKYAFGATSRKFFRFFVSQ